MIGKIKCGGPSRRPGRAAQAAVGAWLVVEGPVAALDGAGAAAAAGKGWQRCRAAAPIRLKPTRSRAFVPVQAC